MTLPIQPGIFAKTFVRPTLGETLDAVVDCGVSSLQFNFSCVGLPTLPEHIEPEQIAEIRRELTARGLHVAAVSGTFNLIHPDLELRRQAWRRFPVLVAACAQLGASVITLCSGTRDPADMWRRHPDNDSPAAWQDLVTGLGELLGPASASGVTLAIEPELGNVIDSSRKCRQLLDELKSPRLGVVLDAANLVSPATLPQMDEIIDEAFDLLGPDLVLAHAKELGPDGHPDGRGPGQGILDWDHLLARLRQARFGGAWILHGLSESDVPGSVAFLRRRLKCR